MEHAIEISMDDVDPDIAPQLRAYAERRLSFALRRFQEHVRHVRVRLTDVNGPRHGVDARCAVTAQLTNGKRVFVDIVPHYRGTSMRPHRISVIWVIDGESYFREFPNEKRGK